MRSNQGLTDFFLCKKGLQLGFLLSPLLFALFLNDLNTFLLNDASGITIRDIQIFTMLYAGDLILLTESEEDLKSKCMIKIFRGRGVVDGEGGISEGA